MSSWTCPAAGLWNITATFGFSMASSGGSCSFMLYKNGSEVWSFMAWYNVQTDGQGATTPFQSILLNLASGNTLGWHVEFYNSANLSIGGGNNNSGNTIFNAIRIVLDTQLPKGLML